MMKRPSCNISPSFVAKYKNKCIFDPLTRSYYSKKSIYKDNSYILHFYLDIDHTSHGISSYQSSKGIQMYKQNSSIGTNAIHSKTFNITSMSDIFRRKFTERMYSTKSFIPIKFDTLSKGDLQQKFVNDETTDKKVIDLNCIDLPLEEGFPKKEELHPNDDTESSFFNEEISKKFDSESRIDCATPKEDILSRVRSIKLSAKEAFALGELESVNEIYTQAIFWLTEEINMRDPNFLASRGVENRFRRKILDLSDDTEGLELTPSNDSNQGEKLPCSPIEDVEKTAEGVHEDVLSVLKKELSVFYSNRALIYFKLDNLSQALLDSKKSGKLGFWKGYYRSSYVLQRMGRYQEALDNLKIVNQMQSYLTDSERKEVKELEIILENETMTNQVIAGGDEREIIKKFESLVRDYGKGTKAPEKLIAQFVYFFAKRKNVSYVWRIFHFIQENQVDVDIRVYTSILHTIVSTIRSDKKDVLVKIKEVLSQIEKKHVPLNDVGHTLLLRYVIPLCDSDDVEGWPLLTTDGVLSSLENLGFKNLSFVNILAFLDCEKTIRSPVMKAAFSRMAVQPDVRLFTSLVVHTKEINTALDIHNFMLKDYGVDYTVPFYNALLHRLSKAKDKRTLAIYRAMRRNNLLPDAFTYRILLREARIFNNISLYDSVMDELEKRKISLNDLKLTFYKKSTDDHIQRSERKQFVKAKQSYTVQHTEESTNIEKRTVGYEDISKKKSTVVKTGKFGHRF